MLRTAAAISTGTLPATTAAVANAARAASDVALKPTVKVAVTGAAGAIGYALLFRIASGEMLGANQPVDLHLLELPHAMDAVQGTMMEIQARGRQGRRVVWVGGGAGAVMCCCKFHGFCGKGGRNCRRCRERRS